MLKPSNRSGHDGNHVYHSASESVGVTAGRRNLVDAYVNGEVGICLYVHSGSIPGQGERGDYCFVFQKDVAVDMEGSQRDAVGKPEFGIGSGSPRPHYVKFPVSINSGPVVQDLKGSMGIRRQFVGLDVSAGEKQRHFRRC